LVRRRAKAVQPEIEFALRREEYAGMLAALQNKGELPTRVTHNDTKPNNVLFDRAARKALCVIDLDTVMLGLSVNDFGDSIRFGASTGVEKRPEQS
jgi:Ser/Thr protein kinase RdoA (MazF antagonist)